MNWLGLRVPRRAAWWSPRRGSLSAFACVAAGLATTPSAWGRITLIPPPTGPDVNTLGVERDGTRRTVAYGLRTLVHPDGSVEVADQVFPLARGVSVLELPARLGRGFLFWISSSGRSSLWRAKSYSAALEPLSALDFEIERIVPGFDRLYVQARRSGDWVALDAESGAGMDHGSLPASPSYGSLAFADEWLGAVELPIRGLVVSFDAGGSWHPLPRSFKLSGEEGGELLLMTPDGRVRLTADGSTRPVEGSSTDSTHADGPRRIVPEGPLGRAPLSTALLRGALVDADSAAVVFRGSLARVRLQDGHVLETRSRVVSASSECSALTLHRGSGFVCQEPSGQTDLYALVPPLSLQLVRSYPSPRKIVASENGGFVLSGGCGTGATAPRQKQFCIHAPNGIEFEVPAAEVGGVERAVALRNGEAALLLPPRAGRPGQLVFRDAKRVLRALPLVLDAREEAVKTLLSKGFWLDALVETGQGDLATWVVGQGNFAGVHISADGHVHVGPVRRRIEHALISGERALLVAAVGIAEQSVDGGRTFTDVDLPADLELDPAKLQRSQAVLEQGCSRLGCAFAGWLRVGWDGPDGSRPLPVAPLPKATSLVQPGGGRWILRCSPTGESSNPALPSAPPAHAPEGQAPWLGLFEQPAPSRPRDAQAFDTGGDGELRAYAWAPRGADFGKAGRFAVSVLDAFRVRGGVWSSLSAPSPWQDAQQVSEIFGYESSVSASWHLDLDPSGRAGVLSVGVRGSTDLFAVEENRAVSPLLNASQKGVGPITSVVQVGTTYYIAAQEEQRGLRVFALEGGEARLLGQYADLPQGRGSAPELVRGAGEDALGIWTRGPGWFVFPLDMRTGAVEPAIEVTPRVLSRVPRSCEPDEDGYLLEGPVGVEPYVDFVGGAERVAAHGFKGRFVVSDRGICVRELAALADAPIDRSLRVVPSSQGSTLRVPLVVSDRNDHGRRWGFRCAD